MGKSCYVLRLLTGVIACFVMTYSLAVAADKVVVIPIFSDKSKPPAPVAKTGQTQCYDSVFPNTSEVNCLNTGQDGELQKGIAWPVPRFTDNLDGTVTDNLTGLIWLQNAYCRVAVTRDVALTFANALFDGYGGTPGEDCGLADGSVAGDWRLPNRFELESLLDLSQSPALPAGHPFLNVQADSYWTSSYNSFYIGSTWTVHFSAGEVDTRNGNVQPSLVWLVRGGGQ